MIEVMNISPYRVGPHRVFQGARLGHMDEISRQRPRHLFGLGDAVASGALWSLASEQAPTQADFDDLKRRFDAYGESCNQPGVSCQAWTGPIPTTYGALLAQWKALHQPPVNIGSGDMAILMEAEERKRAAAAVAAADAPLFNVPLLVAGTVAIAAVLFAISR